jgi:hypothetical protein
MWARGALGSQPGRLCTTQKLRTEREMRAGSSPVCGMTPLPGDGPPEPGWCPPAAAPLPPGPGAAGMACPGAGPGAWPICGCPPCPGKAGGPPMGTMPCGCDPGAPCPIGTMPCPIGGPIGTMPVPRERNAADL